MQRATIDWIWGLQLWEHCCCQVPLSSSAPSAASEQEPRRCWEDPAIYKSALFNSPTLQIPSVGSAQLLHLGPTRRATLWTWSCNFGLIYKCAWNCSCWHGSTNTFMFFFNPGKNAITYPHTFAKNPALLPLNCNLCCPDVLMWCWLHFTSFTYSAYFSQILAFKYLCVSYNINRIKTQKATMFAIIPF